MVPSLSPLSDGSGMSRNPPPFRFRCAVPPISDVKVVASTEYVRASGSSAAAKAGLRYEEHVQNLLLGLYDDYMPAPRVHFTDRGGYRYVIPDGLLVRPDKVFVFEIKSQHMPEAWWQLRRLYEPVLRVWTPHEIYCIEICKTFDPQMPFNETPVLLDSLAAQVDSPTPGLGVFVWKP